MTTTPTAAEVERDLTRLVTEMDNQDYANWVDRNREQRQYLLTLLRAMEDGDSAIDRIHESTPSMYAYKELRAVAKTIAAQVKMLKAEYERVIALHKGIVQRVEADRDAIEAVTRERIAFKCEAQAAHIQDNANKLKQWEFEKDEARCRELCSMYLNEFALMLRLETYDILAPTSKEPQT